MTRRPRVKPDDKVICAIWNPVTETFGPPFAGVVKEREGVMFLVQRARCNFLTPLQRKEIRRVCKPI